MFKKLTGNSVKIGSVLLAMCVTAMCSQRAGAEERRFAVMLAVPPKSPPPGYPNYPNNEPRLPNPVNIYRQYFGRAADGDISFAEYWKEISYGNVNVSGNVLGWVEVPWPILPASTARDVGADHLDETKQMFQDGSGLVDNWFTPGERFRDLNENGKYDSAGEDTRDGYGNVEDEGTAVVIPDPTDPTKTITTYPDAKCKDPSTKDGIITINQALKAKIDVLEWCESTTGEMHNGYWDVPEPFEDYLRIYYNGQWIRLDPSYKNPDTSSLAGGRAWAEKYIRANYPGLVGTAITAKGVAGTGFLGRFGNDKYDGPDYWTDADGKSSSSGYKLQLQYWADPVGYSPDPEFASYPWNYATDTVNPGQPIWWTEYWKDMHHRAGVLNPPPAPVAPLWQLTIPNVKQFDPALPNTDPENRGKSARPFEPNVGGTDWNSGVDCPPGTDPLLLLCYTPPTSPPTASLGTGALKEENHIAPGRDVLPDALGYKGYYEGGPAEYSDLPSSIYHAHSVQLTTDYSTIPPTAVMSSPASGVARSSRGFGDGRFGEVTSPHNKLYYGDEDYAPPAGPLAYNVHGSSGFVAGNVATLEFLTWLNSTDEDSVTHKLIYATANTSGVNHPEILKRDYNLDGLLDQGVVRPPDTESYYWPDPTWPYSSGRDRLAEDVIAVLDPSVDFDQLVTAYNSTKYVFGAVLLPYGMTGVETWWSVRDEGSPPSFEPTLNLGIQTQDVPLNETPIKFSDYAAIVPATPAVDPNGFKKEQMSEVYLRTWEGYPFLYDPDSGVYEVENYPVGIWDIMANGWWVHPSPVLKAIATGRAEPALSQFGQHRPWIDATDLSTVLQPFEKTTVKLTDYAFDPEKSAFYFEKLDDPGERFYFWRLTRVTPTNPLRINFSKTLPGDGVMIMHTDLGDNPESLPSQQRLPTHFAYNIIQADGLGQMDNGENPGDAGDPWPYLSDVPGSDPKTTWNGDTYPDSRWWGRTPSGLSITDIRNIVDLNDPDHPYSMVTFLYEPRLVPSLRFINPPGGVALSQSYVLKYEAFDFHGGTTMEFFVQTTDFGYTGTSVGTATKGQMPDPVIFDLAVPMSALPSDGLCYFYAKLTPGVGADGITEPAFSTPHANSRNRGHGILTVDNVDLAHSKLESWMVTCVDDTNPGAEQWEIKGSLSGILPQRATTGVPFVSAEAGISLTVQWCTPDPTHPSGCYGPGLSGNATVDNTNDVYTLTDPAANFVASEFKESDTVRILPGVGPIAGVYSIKSVLSPTTLELASDAGTGTAPYRVHSFQANNAFGSPDVFTFMTTGTTAYSLPIKIVHGELVTQLNPVITMYYPDALTNPDNRSPLRIRFDASETTDEAGMPDDPANPRLTYRWDFGDGNPMTSTAVTQEVVFDVPHVAPDTVTVTLTVTNPATGVEGSAQKTFSVNPMMDGLAIASELGVNPVPEGGTAPLRIKLNQQPPKDVTVTATVSPGNPKPHHLSVTGATVTIAKADWNKWQTITLAAAEDDDLENREAAVSLSAAGLLPTEVTAVEQDNDTPVILTSVDTINVPEGGTAASFAVKLSWEPAAPIVIQVGVNQGTPVSHISLQSAANLTFTPGNWNVDQQVQLVAAEDDDVANRSAVVRMVSAGVPDKEVVATEVDNDTQKVLALPTTVSLPEGGPAQTFNVRLSNEPETDLTVNVAVISGDPDISVASGTSLVFTPANWKDNQPVSLLAAEDADAIQGTATVRGRAVGSADALVTAVEEDNDALIIKTDVTTVAVEEEGTGTFNVKLSAAPDAGVTVSVIKTGAESDGRNDITVISGSSLVFTPANWNVYQAVILAAAKDPDATNATAQLLCRAIGGSVAIPEKLVTASELDNDRMDLIVANAGGTQTSAISVTEASLAQLQVKLTAAPIPGSPVTVTAYWLSGDPDITVQPSSQSRTFTSANWSTFQSITIAAAGDVDRINGQAIVRLSSSGIPNHDVTVTEMDNTFLQLLTIGDSVTVQEGSSIPFNVTLSDQPTSNVIVNVAHVGGAASLSVTGNPLVFTPADWNVTHSVTFAAASDVNASNDFAVFRFSGTDVQTRDVTVNEQDIDTQAIATNVAALSVPEAGTATLQVKLARQPVGSVDVNVAAFSGDPNITVSSVSKLTFTTATWNNYQPVTLQASGDADSVNGTTVIRCSSPGLLPHDVVATENDINQQSIVAPGAVTVVEGKTVTFAVKLNAAPVANTVVNVTKTSGPDTFSITSGTSLQFTPDNWYINHPVTVAAAKDADLTNAQAVLQLSATGIPLKEIAILEQDVDTNKQPTAAQQAVTVDQDSSVTITLVGSDPDGSPGPLTFAIVTNPTNGTLSQFNAATGSVVYTPAVKYFGSDQFSFKTNDGVVDSAAAVVTITVVPVSSGTTPPPVTETDTDNDGVADASDQCPNTPAGVAVDAQGCPVGETPSAQKDDDLDGVQNGVDQCAGTPLGTVVDTDGCPLSSGSTTPATDDTTPVVAPPCAIGAGEAMVFSLGGLCSLMFVRRRGRRVTV